VDAIVAVLTVLAAVAAIVQTIVTLVERSERKRLGQIGRPQSNRENSSPTWRPPLRSERPVDQEFVDRPAEAPRSLRHPRKKAEGKDYETQSLAGSLPPFDPDSFAANSRSGLAYFFGFIGAFIYRKSPSEKVRFHAAQSLWIDILAVVYFVVAMILISIYIAIRYPGTGHQIPSGDPVMWAWTLTSLVGPPVIHITLAVLAMTGRNPRIPLVWKIAATMSARQEERLASDEQPPPKKSLGGHELPLPGQPAVKDYRDDDVRNHRPSRDASMQTDEDVCDHAERSNVQSLQQVSPRRPRAGEVVQQIAREASWDLFRTERGNEEGSHVTFISYKWLYWLLTILVLILDFFVLIGMFTFTSLGARIIGGIFAALLIFLAIGFGGMAKSPIRLEIGAQGVQLFARSGTTWLPWEVIERIDIKKIGGIPYLVTWLRYSDVFPDFDAFGGGPRFLPKIDALAVCSLSVLHAPRHQIMRALRTYGGRSVGQLPKD